jgi:hypothetical protein
MIKKKTRIRKFRPEIDALKINQTADFPIEKLTSIRALASEVGLTRGRKFQTMSVPDKKIIKVIRLL